MMERAAVIAFLEYPDKALVEHAVARANLTAKEIQILDLKIYQDLTAEQAAERLNISVGTVKTLYNAALGKLGNCWGGLPWVAAIIKK